MSTPSTIQTDVPLVNAPFVDPNTGQVTETWFLFLIQLWRRTGGSSGSTPETLTLDDVLALETVMAPIDSEQDARVSEMVFPPLGSIASGGAMADQTFSSGTDFTPGTTTALTLGNSFANASQLWVFFDGTFQGDDQYSLSGTTLQFTSAIPVGVEKVYVKGMK
jgi:hypothetical protein